MGPATHTFVRRARRVGAGIAVVGALLALVGFAGAASAEVGCTRVMGAATTPPAQLAAWFATTGRSPKLDVSVADLAGIFVEEGAREGVRGDLAFAQAVVETGYFGFSPSVPPELHNYSGIGATGGGVRGAPFPDARTGVRAQIQHLRAYADPSLRSEADLKAPLVDPRFRFLVPNARTVPCWEQFGGGVWAADPTGYGPRVLSVHQRIAAVRIPTAPAPAPAPAPAVTPDVAAPTATAEAPVGITVEALPVGDGAVATELAEAPALASGGLSLSLQESPGADLATERAVALRPDGGATAPLAAVLVGVALLTICSTLWWHGRRFATT